ncbi:hypothetical protein BC834DRAFT_939214, partial [Gloeopeniophorella convolvens]
MGPQNIVPASGLNDLSGSSLLIASKLIRTARNVKIYRSQCEDLSKRCHNLVSALRDHSPGLEGTQAQQAVDEVERVLTRILDRVNKWAELNKMRSFVKQTEIKIGLEESERELEACSIRFNIALHLYANHRSNELEEIRKRDHDELIDMITRVLQDQSLFKFALASATPEDAQSVVRTIEQELKVAELGGEQGQDLQEEISELRTWVDKLPPMVDLTPHIVRTSDHAVVMGGSQDIYTGEWFGQEVALGYPRNQTRAAQERFHKQVEIWRVLRHPNILQLFGLAYIGDYMYSVSPYMDFGNVLQYLKQHPEANRLALLGEVASATEYLHANGIVHGDIRGTNILISGTGQACLCDFGSARIEQVPVTEALSYGNPRWLAPELMTHSNHVPTTRATDIWSFGMLCIEIFTDNVPYSNIQNEVHVPLVIRDGTLPARPENSIITRALSDTMWDLMNQCWRRDPEERPSMSEIREAIKNMLPLRSGTRQSRSSPIPIKLPHVHGHSISSVGSATPSGSGSSYLTALRPTLSPPTAPLPLPSSSTRDENFWYDAPQSGAGPSTSLIPHKRSPILKDAPLSSSPPSGGLTPSGSRPTPTRPLPSPPNPSPLSSSLQIPPLSTTPESHASTSASSDQQEWALQPLSPLRRSHSTSDSQFTNPLILEPVYSPVEPHEPSISRSGSISAHSVDSNEQPRTASRSVDGLLAAAVRDTEPVLRRAADGTVEAGTLEGLVDRLIRETHDRVKDGEFQKVFLTTYRIFTNGDDLFRILDRRFQETGGTLFSAFGQGSIRYSVLLFIRAWLRAEGEYMSHELLYSIRDFASAVTGSGTMESMAREIASLVTDKLDIVVASPASPASATRIRHGTGTPSSPEQIKAVDIAHALTIIEGDCYNEITQADYIAHIIGTPFTNHIETATKTNNRLVNWVKTKVLSSDDVTKRANNFKLFLLTAEECRKQQNFSSMSAIVAALQSATLASSASAQLVLTRESKLTKNSERQLLRRLDDLLDPQGDHRAYRDALEAAGSPHAIPWLAVHLRSLKASFNMGSAVLMHADRPLIHFRRCAQLLALIVRVRAFRAPPPPPAGRGAGALA